MRTVAVILILFCFSTAVHGQDDIRKNIIMGETNLIASSHLVYDRLVPIKTNTAFMFGGGYVMGTGFGWGTHAISAHAGISLFGPKSHMEIQLQYFVDITGVEEDDDSMNEGPGLKLAYRYQFNKGLSFRLSTYFMTDIDPGILPTIGIGYAF